MHYKNGRKVEVGDLVIGTTYNKSGVQVGVVKSITPDAKTCNCTLELPTRNFGLQERERILAQCGCTCCTPKICVSLRHRRGLLDTERPRLHGEDYELLTNGTRRFRNSRRPNVRCVKLLIFTAFKGCITQHEKDNRLDFTLCPIRSNSNSHMDARWTTRGWHCVWRCALTLIHRLQRMYTRLDSTKQKSL